MKEQQFTKGEWYNRDLSIFSKEEGEKTKIAVCEIVNDNYDIESLSNARLIASAPKLLETLLESYKLIGSLKLSMLAHPDCSGGSEFDDYTSSAQEMEDEIEELIKQLTGEQPND